jgi:2-methylisocitrate lyase-like PEP mutase family enzyme
VPAERAVEETRARGARYLDAGASGVFVPLLTAPDAIRELVASFPAPLNLLIVPGLAPIAELAALGVRRVSAGGGLSRAAYVAAKECAEQLLTSGRYERMLGGPALDMNKLLAER